MARPTCKSASASSGNLLAQIICKKCFPFPTNGHENVPRTLHQGFTSCRHHCIKAPKTMIARFIVARFTPALFASVLAAQATEEFATYGPGAGASRPPAEVTYSLPAPVRIGGVSLGRLDALQFEATYLHGIPRGSVEWLVGLNWRRFDFGRPAGAPLPQSLQSAALVLGAEWKISERWRARVEALPGVYSDYRDLSAGDFNSPFVAEITHRFHPRLEVGVQFNLDVLRDTPLVAVPGLRWRIADQWVLALWLPRPQIEFHPDDQWTLHAGASLTGGSYRVARDFGSASGRANLNGQPVDYREIRIGAGARYVFAKRFALELSGGWTIDRRFDFHRQNFAVKGDGAPYVQIGFGLLR